MGNELRTRIKTLVMILAMVVCANTGDLMLKRGMTQIGAVEISAPGLLHAFLATVASGTIWIGIVFLLGFMLSYMTVLSWALRNACFWTGIPLMALSFYSLLFLLSWQPVSFVIPASALSYVVGTFGAKYILREEVSAVRWAGVVLVCAGVALVVAG